MTARHLMTKADCIAAFESCNDAAGASFRQSTNTCQIFGDGGLPSCAVVNGWQPGNVGDRSTGPVTSTTGNAAPWDDVVCFSPDLCAPPVCEMQGQCQNSNHNAIFATMTAHSMTKQECVNAFQACGDAAGASWRTSTNTCQIFGDGGIPQCAVVNGWQPGNVGDRSTGPVTSTTGNAAPWIDVVCFSENLCADQPTTEPSEQPTTEPSERPTTEPTEAPTTMPTSAPTPTPGPQVCEKQGQCVNSNNDAIFATMTARHLMTKADCIAAFESCNDAAGASFRQSTNTCQIFGDGGLPSCAVVNGWQPGNVGDRSTGPVTSTTGNAAPWDDVVCFSPDLCAP